MWVVFSALMVAWFVLKFVLHKGGYVHILLIAAISIAGVQLITDRKTRYHKSNEDR